MILKDIESVNEVYRVFNGNCISGNKQLMEVILPIDIYRKDRVQNDELNQIDKVFQDVMPKVLPDISNKSNIPNIPVIPNISNIQATFIWLINYIKEWYMMIRKLFIR